MASGQEETDFCAGISEETDRCLNGGCIFDAKANCANLATGGVNCLSICPTDDIGPVADFGAVSAGVSADARRTGAWTVVSQGQVPTSLPALPGMQIERRILRDADTQTEKPAEPVLKEHPPNLLPAVSVARPLDRKDKAAIIAGYGEDQAMKIFEGRVAAAPGIDWRREKEDPLHGAEIALVCMAIRTSSAAARFVKFKVRFFAYPPASTAAVSILRSDVHPVVLKTQHGDAVTLTWRMDGSSYGADSDGAWTLHQQLAEYMSTHDLEIEVWNAESQMQIAVATLPLHHLLRNGA